MPTRILFVTSGFAQAGAERALYEILKKIDRTRFEPSVLTLAASVEHGHYYEKIVALNIPILKSIAPARIDETMLPIKRRLEPLRGAVVRVKAAFARAENRFRGLPALLARFDVVVPVMIENYLALQDFLELHPNVVVHLVSHRFQYDYDLYGELRANARLRFVMMGEEQRGELRGTPAANNKAVVVPLPIDLTGWPSRWASTDSRSIALFSRLDPARRNEGFAFAMQCMRRDDVEFLIYGRGDQSRMRGLLRMLGIESRVRFMGHVPSLADGIARDQPALAWMISINETVGYGTIEAMASGLPTILYSFGTDASEVSEARTKQAVPVAASVEALAAHTRRALADRDLRAELSRAQRHWVLTRHDVDRAIRELENFYIARE